MTTHFKPGDRVRCIDDAGISLYGWYSASRFEPVEHEDKADDPAIDTDAAAELEKIKKLLDHCQFPDIGSTCDRVKDVLRRYAKSQADTWKEMLEQLEAIK